MVKNGRLHFSSNHNKCGVLVIGQKKQNKWYRLGKETIDEVDQGVVALREVRRKTTLASYL